LLDNETRIIALNSIQKLVAHVLLTGKTLGNEDVKGEFHALKQVKLIFSVT
jgi:hypothetical protein